MAKPLKNKVAIVAIYQFVQIDDLIQLKSLLTEVCLKNEILGTLLIANEGLNGTVAGSISSIDNLLAFLFADPRFKTMNYKKSFAETRPFRRLKVRLKREIVSMGVPNTDPRKIAGKRVNAKQWNKLLMDPNVLTLDTRNIYECEVGTFKNALSPETEKFRDFPKFVDDFLSPEKHKKIAMFCTGGIRCEKASNYMINKGFKEVYHLDGGILKYLETIDEKESLWQGECFVFDERVAVDKELKPGSYVQCFACRRPLKESDLESKKYEAGVSCHHCYGKHKSEKIKGLRERQRQYKLTNSRKKTLGLDNQ